MLLRIFKKINFLLFIMCSLFLPCNLKSNDESNETKNQLIQNLPLLNKKEALAKNLFSSFLNKAIFYKKKIIFFSIITAFGFFYKSPIRKYIFYYLDKFLKPNQNNNTSSLNPIHIKPLDIDSGYLADSSNNNESNDSIESISSTKPSSANNLNINSTDTDSKNIHKLLTLELFIPELGFLGMKENEYEIVKKELKRLFIKLFERFFSRNTHNFSYYQTQTIEIIKEIPEKLMPSLPSKWFKYLYEDFFQNLNKEQIQSLTIDQLSYTSFLYYKYIAWGLAESQIAFLYKNYFKKLNENKEILYNYLSLENKKLWNSFQDNNKLEAYIINNDKTENQNKIELLFKIISEEILLQKIKEVMHAKPSHESDFINHSDNALWRHIEGTLIVINLEALSRLSFFLKDILMDYTLKKPISALHLSSLKQNILEQFFKEKECGLLNY